MFYTDPWGGCTHTLPQERAHILRRLPHLKQNFRNGERDRQRQRDSLAALVIEHEPRGAR